MTWTIFLWSLGIHIISIFHTYCVYFKNTHTKKSHLTPPNLNKYGLNQVRGLYNIKGIRDWNQNNLHFYITGQFNFDKIGVAYPAEVPLRALRFLPAFCGSLITPTVYLLLVQLGLSPYAGAIAGILVIFGKILSNLLSLVMA